MKKVLSVMAVSAFVLTAGVALAGGPGKKADGCPAACQQQIDDLNSSQAQQNEQLGAHGKQLTNHEGRITTLEKNAYNPWYVRAGVRASWLSADVTAFDSVSKEVSSDVGFGGALAVGRQFGQFRAELELAHQKTDFTYTDLDAGKVSGDVSLSTVMANAYYEIPVADAFAVYGMAGIGYGKFSGKGEAVFNDGAFRYDNDANVIAYKIGAGVTYNFADNMAADLGYEYLGTSDPGTSINNRFDATMVKDVDGHNVVASFRFKF